MLTPIGCTNSVTLVTIVPTQPVDLVRWIGYLRFIYGQPVELRASRPTPVGVAKKIGEDPGFGEDLVHYRPLILPEALILPAKPRPKITLILIYHSGMVRNGSGIAYGNETPARARHERKATAST